MTEIAAKPLEDRYREAVVLVVELADMLGAVPMETLFDDCNVDPEKYAELMGASAVYVHYRREVEEEVPPDSPEP